MNRHFGGVTAGFEPIQSGHFSEGWFFNFQQQHYVVRFAHPKQADSLIKDHYLSTKLVNPVVPVARFIHVGTSPIDGATRHLAITERAQGVILDELSAPQYEALVPALVTTLHNIHRSDIAHTDGFGNISKTGTGLSESWSEFIAGVSIQFDSAGQPHNWLTLFDSDILEEPLIDHLYRKLTSMLPFCPEQRCLLHADYAFDNVLANHNEVTAVIDWANAMYGDFLFDVARQQLLQPEWDFLDRFIALYQQEGIETPNLQQRVVCYQCYFTIDAMRFYASIDSDDGYRWIKSKAKAAGLMDDYDVGPH